VTKPIVRMVALPDVSLHVESYGEGPAVVLAHGFGGSARNFRPQARALGSRCRFVLYDSRGHARSSAPSDPALYTTEQGVADLAGVLDALGIPHAVVGGLSMGAGVALRFALAHPERVRGLVLAAFPPGAGDPRGAESGMTQERWAQAFADAIERDGFEAAGEVYAWGPSSGLDPAAAALVRQGFLEHRPDAIEATLRGVLAQQPSAAQLAKQLRRTGVPALVIVGANDALSRRPSEVLARSLPKARLVVVPNAGHVVNLAQPKAFNAALGEFLDGLRES
jgi:pimeloyl-ACP methyl ester carboxylesterase